LLEWQFPASRRSPFLFSSACSHWPSGKITGRAGMKSRRQPGSLPNRSGNLACRFRFPYAEALPLPPGISCRHRAVSPGVRTHSPEQLSHSPDVLALSPGQLSRSRSNYPVPPRDYPFPPDNWRIPPRNYHVPATIILFPGVLGCSPGRFGAANGAKSLILSKLRNFTPVNHQNKKNTHK
jgi:hypothetical protein